MSAVLLPLRTTPSVAEQEGHLMEMEATTVSTLKSPSYTKSVSWQHYREELLLLIALTAAIEALLVLIDNMILLLGINRFRFDTL